MGEITNERGIVYLICGSRGPERRCHYIGFTTNLDERIEDHIRRTKADLLEVLTRAGVEWKIARTWNGDRNFEKWLIENKKGADWFCPVCSGEAAMKRATLKKRGAE